MTNNINKNVRSVNKNLHEESSITETSTITSRRKFIKMAGAGLAMLSIPMGSTIAFAAERNAPSKKIVWLLLRGALDSLHTIIPTGDSHYKKLRPKLSSSFQSPLLALNDNFSLHPALKQCHQWYQDNALTPIVAVSSGYPRRSHFDGQDFLETGLNEIDHDTGWLARAVDVKNKRGLAIARATPISLRSSDNVNTWYPSNLMSAEDDIYVTLDGLYKHDLQLQTTLANGLKVKEMAMDKPSKNKNKKGKFIDLSKACAKLLRGEEGVDCAMLELGGWDTHNNQANRLNNKLSELDQGLAQLKLGLADEWENTVVIVATEFGRTAKENGTLGTDHGTGSALFLAGGALKGGNIKGKWPGLSEEELFKKRDLMPTTNSFSWIANVLAQHWQFTDEELKQVFPHVDTYRESLIK
jgi:uncharacterized protein (DUF1501 family)